MDLYALYFLVFVTTTIDYAQVFKKHYPKESNEQCALLFLNKIKDDMAKLVSKCAQNKLFSIAMHVLSSN